MLKKKRTKSLAWREWVGIALIGLLQVGLLAYGSQQAGKEVDKQAIASIEQAIKHAVVQCYALEGMYPPDMDYIREAYGVRIDKQKYIVHYEIFASNIYPSITVIEKTWRDRHD